MSPGRGRIWIQGAGELASGVALRLFRSGYAIIMAEMDNPLAVRRLVCFSEAVYEGTARVEEVLGVRLAADQARYGLEQVAVVVDPEGEILGKLGADAVVDARLTKKAPAPLPRGKAPLIGLGPGFTCGLDADLIIETHRGACLGEVISQGQAAANTGVPGVIGGESARRVVRAPVAGRLEPQVSIGDMVEQGQVLGSVAGEAIFSPLSGQVRGLVHPRAELLPGEKVGDVDPRGLAVNPNRVSDKALAVAGGVLEALLRRKVLPTFEA